MRYQTGFAAIVGIGMLAACTPPVPDSGAGVGFGGNSGYGAAPATTPQISVPTTVRPPSESGTDANTATATDDSTDPNPGGLSDEQDFGAVSSRETIESDAARLAAIRAQYEQVPVTALPARPGGAQNTIVEFALNTSNAVGQQLYTRSGIGAASKFKRNCAKYTSPDDAQEAFLKRGGPQRDPLGLDPDGDGFACYWDPTPFRAARNAAAQAPSAPLNATTTNQ